MSFLDFYVFEYETSFSILEKKVFSLEHKIADIYHMSAKLLNNIHIFIMKKFNYESPSYRNEYSSKRFYPVIKGDFLRIAG